MEKLYFRFYKPFGVLSQFTDEDGNPGLGKFLKLPNDVYPVGRLDKDSEGLLLLTNDNEIKNKLLDPETGHERTYWVQVEGQITEEALNKLQLPMALNYKGKTHHTRGAKAIRLSDPVLPERTPPIRFRKNIPTSWISLTLSEGKNRQVRKMTAAAGFPTLRLVRAAFGSVTLDGLEPGKLESLSAKDIT